MYQAEKEEPQPQVVVAFRILDHELRAFQVILVIDLCTDQILVAHRVYQQLHAVFSHRRVVFIGDFIESETILETGAAAALHEYAQFQVGIAFLFDQLRNLGSGAIGKNYWCWHFGYGVHFLLLRFRQPLL